MAKYDVTFSCGHTERIVLFGKMKDREKKIAWFEKKGLCKECYNRQENERNGKDHIEKKMLYKDYKNNFAECEIKRGSYNEEEKTIIIYVPKTTGNEYDYKEPEKITAYKGFDKDLNCEEEDKKIKYEEGKKYHAESLEESDFHAHQNPLDAIGGHYPVHKSRYCEVELSGEIGQNEHDEWFDRISATDIKLVKELSIDELAKESIEYTIGEIESKEETLEHATIACNNKKHGAALAVNDDLKIANYSIAAATGDNGVAVAEGDMSIAATTCERSAATAIDYRGIATTTGHRSVAYSEGLCGAATVTSECSMAVAKGEYGIASVTNGFSVADATGECSAAIATRYEGSASVESPTAAAIAWGYEAAAKGCIGSHILLADWRYISQEDKSISNNTRKSENWEFAGAKLIKIDGVKFKADTYYHIVDGIVEETEWNEDDVE